MSEQQLTVLGHNTVILSLETYMDMVRRLNVLESAFTVRASYGGAQLEVEMNPRAVSEVIEAKTKQYKGRYKMRAVDDWFAIGCVIGEEIKVPESTIDE